MIAALACMCLAFAGCAGPAAEEPQVSGPTTQDAPSLGADECGLDMTCAPEPTMAIDDVMTFWLSNCTEIAHTIDAPASFMPTYPTGTRAANVALTIGYIDTVICDQATDGTSTVAPFHASVFGASIAKPGSSADNVTQSFAGLEALSNHPGFVLSLRKAGWIAHDSPAFTLEWTLPPNDQPVWPYSLEVAAPQPRWTFEGSRSAEPEGSEHPSAENHYSANDGQPYVMRWEMGGSRVGGSQLAVTSFASDSYWSTHGGPPQWESANFVRINAGGSLRIEPLDSL